MMKEAMLDLPGPLSRLAVDNQDRLPIALVAGDDSAATAVLAQHVTAAGTWALPSGRRASAPVYAVPGAAGTPLIEGPLQVAGPHWEFEWGRHWLRALTAALGETVPEGSDPYDVLREAGKTRTGVFVACGLEAFIGTASDEAVDTMIRVLLLDTTDHLRAIPDRPFGLLVFARRDTVRWAVPQNSAQLLDRYCEYALD